MHHCIAIYKSQSFKTFLNIHQISNFRCLCKWKNPENHFHRGLQNASFIIKHVLQVSCNTRHEAYQLQYLELPVFPDFHNVIVSDKEFPEGNPVMFH
jgi:hypothetical protein